MFGLVEERINQAISRKKQEMLNLIKEKNDIVRKIYGLEELVEIHDEIENSIKGLFIFLGVGGLGVATISILSFPFWISVLLFTFSIMGLLGEVVNITDSKKLLSIRGNNDNKKVLLSKISELDEKLNILISKVNNKQNSINEYNKMFSDINLLKNHQLSLGNDKNKIKKTCNYFYNKPYLVFDNIDEYNTYLKCNNENIKKNMITSKILTKKK